MPKWALFAKRDTGGFLLRDTFTDADAVSLHLHTMDVGAGWTENAGDWDINGNRARNPTLDVNSRAIASADAGQANHRNSVIVNIGGLNAGAGPVIRLVDASNYWLGYLGESANAYTLYEVNQDSFTSRASAALAVEFNTDYTCVLAGSGTAITGSVNGANEVSFTSSVHQNATRPGIYADTLTGSKFDNFEVTAP